jgi:uncharacterized protein involved in type VI secretion and phage assembly
MAAVTAERDITVSIPAISSEIFFARMEGEDAISSPFAYSLLISTTDMDVEPLTVLGSAAVITVTGDTPRHFHGFVADFALDAIRDDLTFYRMTCGLAGFVVDTDNRIFQNKTVPALWKSPLADAGSQGNTTSATTGSRKRPESSAVGGRGYLLLLIMPKAAIP